MQEWQCVEFSNGLYSISLPILDACQRTQSFHLSAQHKARSAEIIVGFIEEYKDEDDVPIALIEPAIAASLRAGNTGATSQLRQLLLPSHFLTIAREAYNGSSYEVCLNFTEEALKQSHRMSKTALIEAYRLLGMCAARKGYPAKFDTAVRNLGKFRDRNSKKIELFLRGFQCRISGDLLAAESYYLMCFDKDENNFAVCRELAQVYLSLKRYSEASTYARTAYRYAPTNPYIIDIVLSVRLGLEEDPKSLLDDREFVALMNDLERYSKDEGTSFYYGKKAQVQMRLGYLKDALAYADLAVDAARKQVLPYLIRARIHAKRGNTQAATRDIETMRSLVHSPELEEGNLYIIETYEMEFELHINKKEYRQAHNMIERVEGRIPRHLSNYLKKMLAFAIVYDHSFHERELREWADAQRAIL